MADSATAKEVRAIANNARSSRPICPGRRNSRLELFSQVLAKDIRESSINTRGETLAITVVQRAMDPARQPEYTFVRRRASFPLFSGRVKWRSVFPRFRLVSVEIATRIHRQKNISHVRERATVF